MASIRLSQTLGGLTLSTSGASLVLATNDSYTFSKLAELLPYFHSLLPKDAQDHYLALLQAERDAVQTRKTWLQSLQSELAPSFQHLLDNLETLHPEAFL